MHKYGETFRDLRLEKGYTLKQLAKDIMSVSFLSKVERGESDISLYYFAKLLDRLAISYDEFFHIHYGEKLENFETILERAERAFAERDIETIRSLRKQQYNKWKKEQMDQYLCHTVMLDIYESILSNKLIDSEEEAIKTLYEYLFKVEVWRNYELRLYNSTMLAMPLEMVIILSKTAYERSLTNNTLRDTKKLLTSVLINTLIYLTGGMGSFERETEVEQFLTYIEKIGIDELDLYPRNSLLQVKGIYEIRKGNVEEGVERVKKASTIATQLGSHKLAAQIDNYLEIVLEKGRS